MGSLDNFGVSVSNEEAFNQSNYSTGSGFKDWWRSFTGQTQNQISADQLNYQKMLQKMLFEREDNAVQRRATDLEAAGLSKTLAAGGSANAGQQVNPTGFEALAGAHDKKGQVLNKALAVKQSLQNIKSINLQQKQQREQIEFTRENTKNLISQRKKTEKESELLGGQKNLQELELMYAEAFNDRNLSILTSTENLKKLEEEKSALDIASKKLGITEQTQGLIIQQLNKEMLTKNLDMKDKELIAKQIAIDMARHDRDIYNLMPTLPTNTSGALGYATAVGADIQDRYNNITNSINEAGNRFENWLRKKLGKE